MCSDQPSSAWFLLRLWVGSFFQAELITSRLIFSRISSFCEEKFVRKKNVRVGGPFSLDRFQFRIYFRLAVLSVDSDMDSSQFYVVYLE